MRRPALRGRYLSIPTPLRWIGWLLAVLWVLNFVAVSVWSARNDACLRGHTVYVPQSRDENAHPDWVCDVYKTAQNRNPWDPGNEFRTVKSWLTGCPPNARAQGTWPIRRQ
jgi:hypothetical protein